MREVLFVCADSRFVKPRCSLQRERFVTFCIVQKVTKKHTGLRPATSIQSFAGNTFGDTSDDTCRTRFFAQNGGEKALNRCEVRALQRKELERRLNVLWWTVGYGWAEMGDGGRKRVVLDSNKERFVRINGFLYAKRQLLRATKKGLCKRKAFCSEKVDF